MKHWRNVVLKLGHRVRRWPNIKTTLGQGVMFAVYAHAWHTWQYHIWYRPIEIHHRASTNFPADTRRWINAGLTLVQRRRRWINIKTTLIQRLVSAGSPQTAYIDPELRQASPQLLGQQKQFNLSHGISRLPVRIGGGSIHSPATYRRKRWVRWNPCTARPVYCYSPIGAYVVTAIHIIFHKYIYSIHIIFHIYIYSRVLWRNMWQWGNRGSSGRLLTTSY